MFTRRFERRIHLTLAVLILSGTVGAAFGAYVLWPSRREAGYEPDQPIAFSHKIMAGDNQIDCLYCHSGAADSAHAGIPTVKTCMNCHDQIRTKDENGELKPDIKKLLDHWEKKEPIAWNKVNDLADFVYFDHSRHLDADLECQECHGPVEEMERTRREFGLKMSWCLDCHKQEPTEERATANPHWETRGPINCTTCHR